MTEAKPTLTRGTVVIDIEMCKGCELCIPACPPQVLLMGDGRNHMGLRYPKLLAGCTGCAACQLVCPDFCFEVWRYDTPISAPAVAKATQVPA